MKGEIKKLGALLVLSFGLFAPQISGQGLPVITDGPSFAEPETPDSAIAHMLRASLVRLNALGQLTAVDHSELKGIKYFAFYFSASWCLGCRQFTPDLVQFYNDFHPKHPNFEIVLVSNDHSEEDMVNYMSDDHMPWMAIRYEHLTTDRLHDIVRCGGNSIPSLILMDSTGQVLSDTYVNNQYQGPGRVLADIPNIVK